MSNPYFSNSAVFGGKADKDVQRTNAQMDPRFAATTSAQYGATDAASLDSMYNSPAATTADTGRMTYDDVIMKTGGMLAVLVLSGAATWIVAPQLFFVGAIVGLVLGLVNAFKKEPSPVLITLYSIAQGFSWADLQVLRSRLQRYCLPSSPWNGLRLCGHVVLVPVRQSAGDTKVHSIPAHRDGRIPALLDPQPHPRVDRCP